MNAWNLCDKHKTYPTATDPECYVLTHGKCKSCTKRTQDKWYKAWNLQSKLWYEYIKARKK